MPFLDMWTEGGRERESEAVRVSEEERESVCAYMCVRPLTDGMEEGRRRRRGRGKKNEGFNSLPTSVYLEKKPLCHSVILTTYTRANVSPTMTAF